MINTLNDRAIERRAMQIWRDRELTFPAFTRRMRPDAWDRASGAWSRVRAQARRELIGGVVRPDLSRTIVDGENSARPRKSEIDAAR